MVYNVELVKEIAEETLVEYEYIQTLGGDITNALDLVMYDYYELDEPDGLYEIVLHFLKFMYLDEEE